MVIDHNNINTGIIAAPEFLDNSLKTLQKNFSSTDLNGNIQFRSHKSALYICGRVILGVLTVGVSEYVLNNVSNILNK